MQTITNQNEGVGHMNAIEAEEGRYIFVSEALLKFCSNSETDRTSRHFNIKIAEALKKIGPFYAHFGGAGDALLLLSTFLDANPESTVVSFPNSTASARGFFEAFPELAKIYFLPGAPDFAIGTAYRQVLALLPNCQGMGITPKSLRYEEEWNPQLDIFRDYGVVQHPRWIRRFKRETEPKQVVLAPRGSDLGRGSAPPKGIALSLWAPIIEFLTGRGLEPVIIGVPPESAEYPCLAGCRDARSYCFAEQMEVISASRALVGADSWGKTFAALAGVPAIVFEAPPAAPGPEFIDIGQYVFLNPWNRISLIKDFADFKRAFAYVLAGGPTVVQAREKSAAACSGVTGLENNGQEGAAGPVRLLYEASGLGKPANGNWRANEDYRCNRQLLAALQANPECEVTLCPPLAGDSNWAFWEKLFRGQPEIARLRLTAGKLELPLLRFWANCKRKKELHGRNTPLEKVLLEGLRVYRKHIARPETGLTEKNLEGVQIIHLPLNARLPDLPGLRGIAIFQTISSVGPLRASRFFNPAASWRIDQGLAEQRERLWFFVHSQAAKDEICESTEGLNPAKICVNSVAPASFFQPAEGAEITAFLNQHHLPNLPYLLGVCRQRPGRNLIDLFRCYANLLQEEKLRELNLIILGVKEWELRLILNHLPAARRTTERIFAVEEVTEEELPLLYSGAQGLVCTPDQRLNEESLLEMMSCGTPVVAPREALFLEILGPAGFYYDCRDSDDLCHKINVLHQKTSEREALREKTLQRAQQFSWAKCAQETLAGYKKALSAMA